MEGQGRAGTEQGQTDVRPPGIRVERLTATLRRRGDLLSLRFELWNLKLNKSSGPSASPATLSKVIAGDDAIVVVRFPPQHLAEQAFLEKSTGDFATDVPPDDANFDEKPTAPPVKAYLGGWFHFSDKPTDSRLAFTVPDAALPLEYTTASLLSWARFAHRVVPHALPRKHGPFQAKPVPPSMNHTAIELPWRLQLSPHAGGGWAHAIEPVEHGGRIELWHTRLGVRRQRRGGRPWVDETDHDDRTIRAVYALDRDFEVNLAEDTSPVIDDDAPEPVRMSLDAGDRYDIVRLSSDFSIPRLDIPTTGPPVRYEPEPIEVRRLMLSPLGAWIDSRGAWDLPNHPNRKYNSSLQEWRHRGTMGRDHYARIVRKGYLCPTRHRASLIKITERKFVQFAEREDGRGAYLRQRVFIVVRQPVVDFEGDAFMDHHGRKFPFRSLRCTTLVTPNLSGKKDFSLPGDDRVFVAEVSGQPYPFQFVATDWAGREVDFTCPVVWVDDTVAYDQTTDALIAEYNDPNHYADPDKVEKLHRRTLEGQKVVVAPSVTPGDTTVQVQSVWLGLETPRPGVTPVQLAAARQPRFYPTVAELMIDLPEAQAAAGKTVGATKVAYFDTYLEEESVDGFGGANDGGVFLEATPSTKLAFDGASSGGVVTPNLRITGLSRKLGPIGGEPATVGGGTFDPSEVFALDDAKILGGVALAAILDSTSVDGPGALKLTSRELTDPRRVETVLDWHPTTRSDDLRIYMPVGTDGGRLDLTARIVTFLDDPDRSTFSVDGDLREFWVNLFGDEDKFIRIDVRQLRFTAAKDQKTDLDVDIGEVSFHGALDFLSEMAAFMDMGDGGGLTVEVAGDAIAVTLELTIPTIPLGVVTMSNLAFSAGLTIPFDGSPVRARFAFSSREDPFLLTVMGLGGSGWVAVELGADGVELLEFSLGFAAGFTVDVAVASGRVELVGGFYFSVETAADQKSQKITTTLYVDLEGEVTALGIVSVSLELYIALSYVSDPEELVGEAEMTATIEVMGFGDSVTIRVRQTFAGGGASGVAPGPHGQALAPGSSLSWGDFILEEHWTQYASAFAPVGV